MNREDFVELFEIQLRGTIATAFMYSRVEPTAEQWQMLRGSREVTMRDLGEIGHATGHNMHMQLSQNRHLERDTTEGDAT